MMSDQIDQLKTIVRLRKRDLERCAHEVAAARPAGRWRAPVVCEVSGRRCAERRAECARTAVRGERATSNRNGLPRS